MNPKCAEMLTQMLRTNRKKTLGWVKKAKKLSMPEFEDLVSKKYEEYTLKRRKSND